jgi:hypothetical protein
MIRVTTAVALVAVCCAAALLASSARATTGPGYSFVIGIRLTDKGVVFTRQQRVPRGAGVEFEITNVSTAKRRFEIGGRSTKLLSPKQREIFFLGFSTRGNITYRSFGPNVHMFTGLFKVV